MVVYIELFPYLLEWFRHAVDADDDVIAFPKSWEEERHLLRHSLRLQPDNIPPETLLSPPPAEGKVKVPIRLPENKEKPPLSYFYIGPAAKRSLEELIRQHFCYELWRFLHIHGRITEENSHLLDTFLELHSMSSIHKDTIKKIYYRQRRRHRNKKMA